MINFDQVWERASGIHVWIDGKKYIDCTSSIFTQNFGHSNKCVTNAIAIQLSKCNHAYDFYTHFRFLFEYNLREFVGYHDVMVFNTGAEAVEAAIKICHAQGMECIGVLGAMHGRTIAAEALVGKRKVQGISTIDAIKYKKYRKRTAFFFEGYRGYDCKPISQEEWDVIWKLHNDGHVIVFDEIQSGCYRTDRRFVSDFIIKKPDILIIGKSIGGGMPVSAVCLNKELFPTPGVEFTTTHQSQPLHVAAGCGVLDFIKNDFDIGIYNECAEIMKHEFALMHVNCRCLGMVGAIETDYEEAFYNECMRRGVLVMPTGKGWIKVAPPVIIKPVELMKALMVIADCVKEYA